MEDRIKDKEITVLVASENQSEIQNVKDHLEKTLGYPCRIWHCSGATRAAGFFKKELPGIDVVLLDLDLISSEHPRDVFRQMQNIVGSVPIIVFTARKDHALALTVVEAGAADNITIGQFSSDPYKLRDSIEFSIARNNISMKTERENAKNLTRIGELDATNSEKMKEHHITALYEASAEANLVLKEALQHGKNDLKEADRHAAVILHEAIQHGSDALEEANRHAKVTLKESIEHGEKVLKDAKGESEAAMEKFRDENTMLHREKDLTIHWMGGGYSM